MTMNGVITLVLRRFTEFDRLRGRLRQSQWLIRFGAEYPLPALHVFWLQLTHAAVARSLCDS